MTHICLADMLICMRTTLNIDDELIRLVKRHALESGQTITKVIEDALRHALSGDRPDSEPFCLRWVTVSGRVKPGVDLADRDALMELMEGRS